MTNTQKFAKQELDILAATVPDAILTPFAKEILALCEAFGKSGQSGGSAPYTASAIAQAVKKLCLQEPICDVTGHDNEWVDVAEWMGEPMYQNARCGGLFKYQNGKCSYNDAIVWKGEEEYDTFTGRVYIDDKYFELIGSSQYARFPFKPKTFYIDVVRVPITKEEAAKIIQVANDTASQNRAKVLATANEEATSLKKRAQEDIEQERKEALNTVKGDVADISVQIAEKLIGQSLDASAQQELIDSYLAKLGE